MELSIQNYLLYFLTTTQMTWLIVVTKISRLIRACRLAVKPSTFISWSLESNYEIKFLKKERYLPKVGVYF